ncbi:hypothetical protein [Streptomyces lanatus]|uniref:Uncharacterized protein n=1 Tax=Streptomyces lanatus TaxID=66900 RepID=A0ABV1Y1X2_9ACTN|nr:hypothetical protein [Streptomyces lanatus]
MTWHKVLERVCDVTVTSAPRAAGETREYGYDVSDLYYLYHLYDLHDLHDLYDRDLDAGKRNQFPDACE